MAHERNRHVTEIFYQLLKFSPIVGLFGHRQVGKSTFLASKVQNYKTLDDLDTLAAANRDPKLFVGHHKNCPVAIDECQLEPKLFPTLKEWVRTHKNPGQFVLSGSVRFTSRKVIRESLAGRMAFVEMIPLTVSELLKQPLSDVILKLLHQRKFSHDSFSALHSQRRSKSMMKGLETYLTHGGLPGLCFIRSPQLRKNALNDLHDLILSRDLSLVGEIRTPSATVKRLLSLIAENAFKPYNASEIRRVLGLAPQTQKKLLDAMEATFLIRRIPLPRAKKDIILLEDQLEEAVYSGHNLELITRLETAVFRNIRAQFFYRLDKNALFESYLTRDHARVPIVIKHEDYMLGIIIHLGEKPSLSDLRCGASFLRTYGNAKIIYLSYEISSPQVLDERSLHCSVGSVL
jgi:predicted AAA+ superfamily ATPase